MIIRSLDDNHDWNFGHGLGSYLTGQPAIGLNIETRLLEWKGDCFFNTNTGVDYVNRLGSKGQRQLLESDQRRVILASYGVTGITVFDSVLNGRSLTTDFATNTIFSQAYQQSVSQGVTPNAG